MRLYLGYPIDQVRNGTHRELVDSLVHTAKVLLAQEGHDWYDPGRAWTCSSGTPQPQVQQVNDRALESSEGVLVLWPHGVPSVGLGLEVAHAVQHGLPVAVVNGGSSWALAGKAGVEQFEDLVNALHWLQDQDQAQGPAVKVAGPGEFSKAHQEDAGYDLHYHGNVPLVIRAGECVDVPAGVAVEWPQGMWGFLVGRSSSFRNRGLLVNPAIIDAGFRGDLFAIVRNIGQEHRVLSPGERVAQIIPMPTNAAGLAVVRCQADELTPSERGTKGFGSSGL